MPFFRFEPARELSRFVECYWMVDDDDTTPAIQKIIPDGFPEIIFHYGDPYRIKLHDSWEKQAPSLFAGQISKFFFLENTGRSAITGIKFKPAALTHIFDVAMAGYVDRVVPLSTAVGNAFDALEKELCIAKDNSARTDFLNEFLFTISVIKPASPIEAALATIFETRGMASVADICSQAAVSERQLERLFKKYIGLSPKFYSRIIRFSHIFHAIENKDTSWVNIGLEAGFYDQPHFIKNFKAFTGEEPSKYFFDQPNLANFFLRKP